MASKTDTFNRLIIFWLTIIYRRTKICTGNCAQLCKERNFSRYRTIATRRIPEFIVKQLGDLVVSAQPFLLNMAVVLGLYKYGLMMQET